VLTLLKIKNVALIDEIAIEFGPGLNLLTGETGSGKSIIVDSLGALTGARVTSDLIKEGEASASIEGLFSLEITDELKAALDEAGIEDTDDEMIVRRDLSAAGKNRVFVNGQLVTQGFLRRIGQSLVDIHGQGEQTALYDTDTHIAMLDEYADVAAEKARTAAAYQEWSAVRAELRSLERDASEKLQLIDVLRFQVDELKAANLKPGEEAELEEEKHRLVNVEKLTSLSEEAFALLYENEESTAVTLEKAQRKVAELATFDSKFSAYTEGIEAARAVIEDLSFEIRNFRSHLEFSPERLDEIENRLAEILRLRRKYGGTVESAIEHLQASEERLRNIEMSEFRREELEKKLAAAHTKYLAAAAALTKKRTTAGVRFGREAEQNLKAVALEKARFEVRVEPRQDEAAFSEEGVDRVEFFFSANPGESPKPLARVASGGEASRLMLILKTTIKESRSEKTAVFDEVDVGIGGRVSEAVGRKLKDLSATQQVLCVTHQPQVASLADHHFVVSKQIKANRTTVSIRELSPGDRVEEIARMLAGSEITEAARENARTLIGSQNRER
jgi:DNA repair protein RecN (Recombination protein N)